MDTYYEVMALLDYTLIVVALTAMAMMLPLLRRLTHDLKAVKVGVTGTVTK